WLTARSTISPCITSGNSQFEDKLIFLGILIYCPFSVNNIYFSCAFTVRLLPDIYAVKLLSVGLRKGLAESSSVLSFSTILTGFLNWVVPILHSIAASSSTKKSSGRA